MSDWQRNVHFDDYKERLVASIPLDFLQAKSPIRLVFNETEEMDMLAPETEAAADALLQRLPALEKLVADTALEHYQMIRKEFGRIYGEQVVIPKAENALELQQFYQLQAIYLPEQSEVGRFGLAFSCEWEEEHGFGIQFRNWQIVEVGGYAEAFSFDD